MKEERKKLKSEIGKNVKKKDRKGGREWKIAWQSKHKTMNEVTRKTEGSKRGRKY